MTEENTTQKAVNTISLTTAQAWAKKWRDTPGATIKAHLIPQADITQLMAEKDVVDVRAYIGIDENGINKLMLVGVDTKGNDLIDDTNEQYIYDFTQPCPDTCNVTSPLYTLK
ncbi:hypothetical protein LZZ90_13725 [Flavobacterium sp. SM15]|uniref:hypothetical protein n=1 Tax=Flavobacterium sp. SM15 TaxID=2908005 RepID=UPI001EDC2D7C|nr:hypothetical protein [Flavobacterium sp. SM15]MCG2612569.1 hypothetical protein [Flavobacterium sp. SM15]